MEIPLKVQRRRLKDRHQTEFSRDTRLAEAWDHQAEVALMRHICLTDFWSFFLYAFGAGLNPKGQRWIDLAVHEPLAKWFQHHVDEWFALRNEGIGEQKHLAIVIHREVGKTTMITQAGQLWIHLRDPEASTYTGSERTELSAKILGGMKAVLDGSDPYSLFTKLYGNWATDARSWTGKDIVHAARKNTSRRDPSMGTFAVETSIVGAHPDAWFYDDPISYERLLSDQNWLQSVNSQVVSMVPVIQSDGLIVWPGTRYDDDDHFGKAFKEQGVRSLTGMPTDSITVTEDGLWDVYFMCGRDEQDKPTTPKVWPERRLKEYQKLDPLRYAAQVMNDPALSQWNPITKDQCRQCIMPKSEVPWSALRYAILTDTAFWDGKSRASKDETVLQIWGYPRNGSGDVYFIEGYSSPTWRAEEFANRIVSTVQRYRRQNRHIFAITDEDPLAAKRGTWRLSLQNYFNDANERMPRMVEFRRNTASRAKGGDKGARLVSAASFWVDGHVRLVEGAPGIDQLIEQMGRIGQYLVNQRLKIDWADAAADAFNPEIYQPMRRAEKQAAPWERGAQPIAMDGLDQRQFDDDESRDWRALVPREPIR